MKALILAAGAGRKIWPYNETRQKCALPVGNVPAVRRLADDLLTLGIDGLMVGVGHLAASVRHALHGLPDEKVRVMDVGGANGTAEAAWSVISATDNGDAWLVVYGDLVCPRENLAALAETFRRDAPPAAAALVAPLGRESALEWIAAKVEGDRLAAIEGHSRNGDGGMRLCGAFVFGPAAFSALRDNPGIVRHVPVGGMPPVESDIAESLQLLIDDGLDVAAVTCPEFFVDLDKPWHILEANHLLLNYLAARADKDIIPASCRISDAAEIEGRLLLGENVTIGKRAVIRGTLWAGDGASITNGPILDGNVMIGRVTKVRDYCHVSGGTVYGDRGIIAHGAEFGGVAFETVYLYHYCELSGVLGSCVDIGAATVCGTLRFDDREGAQRVQGRLEVPPVGADATYIGDHSRTGVNAILMPGRKIGCYSCVGPGVILYDDLPSRQAIFAKQELEFKSWGPERYGW